MGNLGLGTGKPTRSSSGGHHLSGRIPTAGGFLAPPPARYCGSGSAGSGATSAGSGASSPSSSIPSTSTFSKKQQEDIIKQHHRKMQQQNGGGN